MTQLKKNQSYKSPHRNRHWPQHPMGGKLTMLNHKKSCFCLYHLRCNDIAAKHFPSICSWEGKPLAILSGLSLRVAFKSKR